MLTVHHLENSRSQRILWLLEELGVEYELKRYERDPQTSQAPAELRAVHPLGKSPIVTDGDATVAESGAIIEYLADRYDDGTLRPAAGTAERMAWTYWLHYAEGSFMPLMVVSLILSRIESAPVPFFIKPITKAISRNVKDAYLDANVRRHLEFMEEALAGSQWFCGESFTAADVQMAFVLEAAEARVGLDENLSRLQSFLERVRARPAYRAALERGGPFSLLDS